MAIRYTELLSKEKIAARIQELGAQITKDYAGCEVTVVCILKGSVIFFSDLIREIKVPVKCEFISVSSYGDAKTSSGEVKLNLDISTPLDGRHILIVEDIVDSGLTLKFLRDLLAVRRPASIKCCTFLRKPDALKVDVAVEYRGFDIPNDFVIGYGLDFAQNYRELPFVAKVDETSL
jgi:hypoxanthine phosphoribosyltransferase